MKMKTSQMIKTHHKNKQVSKSAIRFRPIIKKTRQYQKFSCKQLAMELDLAKKEYQKTLAIGVKLI